MWQFLSLNKKETRIKGKIGEKKGNIEILTPTGKMKG